MRKLCAVFAHPDDESFSIAGTLAKYADEGVETTLITATRGEAGEVAGREMGPDELAEIRERELRTAAEVLGVHHLRLLGLPDGQLADRFDDLYASIKGALAELRPDVLIAEDARGITGHPDHIAVTRAVIRAFDDLGEAAPLKLYEHVVPASIMPEGLSGTPDDYITTTVDVDAWGGRIMDALRAHRSQVGEEMLNRFESFHPRRDHFICIRSRVPIVIPERDLFASVPA
jgi:N-acetylglucosamine malate deacetylase 2